MVHKLGAGQSGCKSSCSDFARRSSVEMVIYLRNAVDVKNSERIGVNNEHNDCC